MKKIYKVLSLLLIVATMINTTIISLGSEVQLLNSSTTTASVDTVNNSTYSAIIPSAIHAGDLSPNEENIVDYSIFVDNYDINQGQIIVSSKSGGKLVHETDFSQILNITNSFSSTTVIEDSTLNGQLQIKSDQVRTASEGAYNGTISFTFEYQYFGGTDVEAPDFQWSTPADSSTATNVTGGVFDYVDALNLNENEKIDIVFSEISNTNTNISTDLEGFFDESSLESINNSNQEALINKDNFLSENFTGASLKYHYSINIVKTTEDDSKSLLTETGENVLELRIGYDNKMVGNDQQLIVLREHEGNEIDSFDELSSKPVDYVDGTFYADEDYIYLYSSKFSVYSIGVADKIDDDSEDDNDSDGNNNDNNDSNNDGNNDNEDSNPLEDLPDGTYEANVSMLQHYNTSAYSMCDVLFYETADITVSGDDATLTLYVIDPIPNFSSYGTPISDVWFEYEGKTYDAVVSNYNNKKYFQGGNAFITDSGEYTVSKLTVTVPKEAILDAYKTTISCSAFVDAVMNSRQQFWVILDIDGVSGDTQLPDSNDGNTDSNSDSNSNNNSNNGSNNTGGSSDSNSSVTELTDGSYTADVTMLQYYNTSLASMCDVLFYNKADIVVSGNNATLTLYVIDPIPNFSSYGTPLSDVLFEYEGTQYNASINSYSGTKYFEADGSFISESGEYSVSALTVTLPKNAILEAYQPSLVCSPYVDAVMMSRQQFYVILEVDGITSGSSNGTYGGSGNLNDQTYTDGELNDVSLEGTYIGAVDFKKEADFESYSMCDTLFYSYSDIIIKDDMATVILYIIDPIPGYEVYGTPITDVTFEYDGVTYSAEIDTSDQQEQYFPADDRFIFESDDYYTSKIIVTVPAGAIETSPNASLKCTGFVNAVMNSYQTFYVVFSELEWVSESTDDSMVENSETNNNTLDSSNINSIRIHGSSIFVWMLLLITILTTLGFIGYYVYKRRNQ